MRDEDYTQRYVTQEVKNRLGRQMHEKRPRVETHMRHTTDRKWREDTNVCGDKKEELQRAAATHTTRELQRTAATHNTGAPDDTPRYIY